MVRSSWPTSTPQAHHLRFQSTKPNSLRVEFKPLHVKSTPLFFTRLKIPFTPHKGHANPQGSHQPSWYNQLLIGFEISLTITILLFEKDIQMKLLQWYLSLELLYELNLKGLKEIEGSMLWVLGLFFSLDYIWNES